MANSNCCQAGMIEETNFHSNGYKSYSYTCKRCDKQCDPYPDINYALFIFPDGNTREIKFPKSARGLRSNSQRPNRLIFGEHSLSKNNAEEDEYKLWQAKCKLEVNQPKPLKLEVGKRYIRRDGEVSGIIEPWSNTKSGYEFEDALNGFLYFKDGRHIKEAETKLDLIEEACIDTGTGTTCTVGVDIQKEQISFNVRKQQMQDEIIPPIKAGCTTVQETTDLEHVLRALRGDMKPSQQRIAEVGLDWLSTLVRKNSDYGDSAWTPPVLVPDLGSRVGILVRMSDKIKRLNQLRSNQALVDESYNDTIKDLGAYCLLYLAAPEEKENHESKTN